MSKLYQNSDKMVTKIVNFSKNTQKIAILGKKFVKNFSELLLDKFSKLWYN